MERKVYLKSNSYEKMKQLTAAYPDVENGGLLFGRMNPSWIKILDVSDAGEKAIRTKTGVVFEVNYLQQYTQERLREDLFVIGTWHSHPAPFGLEPSFVDKKTMTQLLRLFSKPYLPVYFIVKLEEGEFLANAYTINDQNTIMKEAYIVL